MVQSKLGVSKVYPVRAIANRNMVDPEFLPLDALSKNLQRVEEAIVKGELLELNRFPGGASLHWTKKVFF
ncbi:MAG: hypothetical protein V7K92_12850 [Nostoc sp.]|uniref:hypothetical protein n=1 Tax=Nostoc sp. TaxID=1180 RepID=UPI002FF22215